MYYILSGNYRILLWADSISGVVMFTTWTVYRLFIEPDVSLKMFDIIIIRLTIKNISDLITTVRQLLDQPTKWLAIVLL